MVSRRVGLIAAAFVLTACSPSQQDGILWAGAPAVSTAPVAFLEGDCVRLADGSSLRAVDCRVAHDGEVVLSQERFFTGDDLPAESELARTADTACAEALVRHTPDASVRMSSTYPTAQTWAGGDRHLTCVAMGALGK